MTFRIHRNWIAVRIDQMESVALAPQLWPVPTTPPEYVGLHDTGSQLVPVMRLDGSEPGTDDPGRAAQPDQLVAVLHVRGESVGLAIDVAGHVLERYWLEEPTPTPPASLAPLRPLLGRTSATSFWLIDTDNLWPQADAASLTT